MMAVMAARGAGRSDEVALPALLSAARRPYGDAIRGALNTSGYDDMPSRGSFVVGGVARNGSGMQGMAAAMGISKQAVSQLVDTLVTRGYLLRAPDPRDRRRMTVTLTDRGRAAAAVTRAAVATVDAALVEVVGARSVSSARRVLGALAQLAGDGSRADGT